MTKHEVTLFAVVWGREVRPFLTYQEAQVFAAAVKGIPDIRTMRLDVSDLIEDAVDAALEGACESCERRPLRMEVER